MIISGFKINGLLSLSLIAVQQFLLFSSQLAVRGIPFNLSSQEDVIIPITGSPSYFIGIDFYAQEDTIFFSDTTKDIICKQKTDGSGMMQMFPFPGLFQYLQLVGGNE